MNGKRLLLFLCLLLVAFFVNALPTHAQVNNWGPTGRVVPGISNPKITITADSYMENIQISLDGRSLTTYCGTIDDGWTYDYSADIPLTTGLGKHQVSFADKTWEFYYDNNPVITVSPAQNSTVDGVKPNITITISEDIGITTQPTLNIDGTPVDFTYNSTDTKSATISYTPSVNLSNEVTHKINLILTDMAGPVSYDWYYYVNTWGGSYNFPWDSLALSDTCRKCHTGKGQLLQYIVDKAYTLDTLKTQIEATKTDDALAKSLAFNEVHGIYKLGSDGKYRQDTRTCAVCHDPQHTSTSLADCAAPCHNTNNKPPTADYNYFNYRSLLAHAKPGGKCDICHGTRNQVPVPYTRSTKSSLKQSTKLGHDFAAQHKPKADFSSCLGCHSQYLWREKEQHSLNCDICHKSTDPKIVSSISNGLTDCVNCHSKSDHVTVHTGLLDTSCQQCHSEIISTEHLSNKTTEGKNYNCDSCHKNESRSVKRAISGWNLACTGCHTQAHGITIVDSIPNDIPLFDQFQWSMPLEASLAFGAPDIPLGYEEAQMVISNRNKNVTVSHIWDYYNNALTSRGWILHSEGYNGNSAYLSAEYIKDNRAMIIKAYNTEFDTGEGEQLTAGYRIELWYK